jgi:metal-responsive CopG/Arc/MetJ family transcriptional regulator
MIIRMRTTLILDDELVRQVKERAARRKMSVSDVVNEALREFLKPSAASARPFSMVTYGRGNPVVSHEPSDFSLIVDDEDRERLR